MSSVRRIGGFGMVHFSSVACFMLALAACLARSSAAEQKPFCTITAQGPAVVISHNGEDYLRIGNIVWGPRWAWMGMKGQFTTEQGAAAITMTPDGGGKPLPVKVNLRVARTAPNQIQLQYNLAAEGDATLTFIISELAPGKAFQGKQIVAESQGKKTMAKLPLGKQGLGASVDTVRLTDPAGAATVIKFDPPCEIASDGAARIVLAKEKVARGDSRKLTITVDLPGETDFYPTSADMPDEPGIADWYPWKATGDTGDSALGMRDWIEAPAGKHGRITRQDDKLIYNGKPIKLWGLNLCYGATAPEKEIADKRAAFYTKYGINAVRLHKFADNFGWGGIQSKNSCVEFEPGALDRMDYQVGKFKQAGIYVKLSAHFGSQKLGPADKELVPFMDELGAMKGNRIETPHSAIHYSPELQKVQILQITNLLKHKNPHTGLTYAEDPAIAYIEIINEQSILFYTSPAPLKVSATLRKQVGQRFCDWLRKKYTDAAGLEKAWGKGALNCMANELKAEPESLEAGTILPIGNPWYWDPDQIAGATPGRRQRMLDTLHFLYTLQCEFFDRYVKAVREAGYNGEILSSNWQAGRGYSHFANLYSDWTVGTIDRHNYFGGASKANASMLARAGSGMFSSGMQQVADRPFMLSEWIHVFPCQYGVEGPAILGAYGLGLQGWDVSFMFQNGDKGTFSSQLKDTWDVTAPQIMGIFPAVARQIYRGDVAESNVTAVRNVHVPSLFEGKLSFDDKVVQGYDDKELDSSKVPARALAVARSVVRFTPEFTETPVFDLKPYEKDGVLVSATGQLQWKEKDATTGGYFTMNTPGTRAVVGFAAGRKLELGNVTIEPQTPFAAIYVTAKEPDKTIDSSKELLVLCIARAHNTGMKYSPTGDRMMTAGAGPIVMEPVKAKITVKKDGAAKVIILDHDGRATQTTLPTENGVITIDGARDKTPYYLIKY